MDKPKLRFRKKPKPPRTKKQNIFRVCIRCIQVFLILAVMYTVCVFSNIPFIEKWRVIYIETAMSTNSHQWLATAFIPHFIIDDVMYDKAEAFAEQENLNSTWEDVPVEEDPVDIVLHDDTEPVVKEPEEPTPAEIASEYYTKYWELNSATVRAYMDNKNFTTKEQWEEFKFEDMDWSEGLKTIHGDKVLVWDIPNNMILVGVENGTDYKAKLCIVKDPAQVDLAKAASLGSRGEIIDNFGTRNGALVAINASGFVDPEGHGNGGVVNGCLVIDGKNYGNAKSSKHSFWKMIGCKYDNRLYVSNFYESDVTEYNWAVEFFPAIAVNGECVVRGTYGLGLQPRTAIGQAKDGTFMLLIVDGRQVGYSVGCTMATCADILIEYGAYQAANLDGGSSSIMWYNGRQITKSSSPSGFGRYLPDAIIVRPAADVTPSEETPSDGAQSGETTDTASAQN